MNCERIELWDEGHKQENNFKAVNPYMETYFLKNIDKRPCVLICPGGGYRILAEREAEPIALRFNAEGYHAAVLYYSVFPNLHPQPLYDLARAICILRENDWEWNIDKVAVCGFSAGGHLAASLGIHNEMFKNLDVYGIDKNLLQLNALILGYPVISCKEFSKKIHTESLLGKKPDPGLVEMMTLQNHDAAGMPPTFIWHTLKDESVPVENSMMFADNLRKSSVPFELHIFAEGDHGMSLANKVTAEKKEQKSYHISVWFKLCIEWLEKQF
jgi:acetyl esterase/lipase